MSKIVDDECEKLRWNALKSKPIQNDEEKLRELALKSISKDKSLPVSIKSTKVNENSDSKVADNDVLFLREQALKSLLKKRVLKTNELLKKQAVQQSGQRKVTIIKPTTVDMTPQGITKPKQSRNIPLMSCILKYREIADFDNKDTLDEESTKTKLVDVLQHDISLDKDDQISLCASEDDETITFDENKHAFEHHKELSSVEDTQNLEPSNDETITNSKRTFSMHNDINNDADITTGTSELNIKIFPKVEETKSYSEENYSESEKDPSHPSSVTREDSKKNEDLTTNSKFSIFSTTSTETSAPCEKLSVIEKSPVDFNKSDTIKRCNAEEDNSAGGLSSLSFIKSSKSSESKSLDASKRAKPLVIDLISSHSDESETECQMQKSKRASKHIKEELGRQTGKKATGGREDLKDITCSVCLGPFENRSFLVTCFHSFCHMCIIQWSELSRLCPLCKTRYDSLIHTVSSDLEYKQYTFPSEVNVQQSAQPAFNENMPDGRRFRYQTTMVDSQRWSERRREREACEDERSQKKKSSQKLKWSATKDRRKAVYRKNMIVERVKQHGKQKVRDISSKFFKDNPALKHRLVPWLLRDLSVLFSDDNENIRFVMSLILGLTSTVGMESEEFYNQLQPFLFEQSRHFIAELISFARSPYDIRGYDDNVVYHAPVDVDKNAVAMVKEPHQTRLLHEIFIVDEERSPVLARQEGRSQDESDHTAPSSDSDSHGNSKTVQSQISNPEIPREQSQQIDDDNQEQDQCLDESELPKKAKEKKHRKKSGKRKNRKRKTEERLLDSDNEEEETKRRKKKRKSRRCHGDGNADDVSGRSQKRKRKKSKERKKKHESETEEVDRKRRKSNHSESKSTEREKHKRSRNKKKKHRTRSRSTSSDGNRDLKETEKQIEQLFQCISKRYNLPLDIPQKNRTKASNKADVLIKDGERYRTRVEIVQELLEVEKALMRQREDKDGGRPRQVAADSTVTGENIDHESESIDANMKAPRKEVKEGKPYLVLMKELQDIEGRINNCRSVFLKQAE